LPDISRAGALMKQKLFTGIYLLGLLYFWIGCASPVSVAPLASATAAPTHLIPSSTATLLPPPTVTLYPALSASQTISQDITATSDGTNQAGESPTALTSSVPAFTPTFASTADPQTNFKMPPVDIALGSKLFNADFSQGWPTINDTGVKISISNGQYDFTVGPRDSGLINTAAVNKSDIYAQVDVSIRDCSEGGGYGLIFRQKDTWNYYAFILFCNSSYSVIARISGMLKAPIQTGPLPEGLLSQRGTHQLGVMAKGEILSIYMDGYLITEVQDNQLNSGDVALYAFSESENIIEIGFDNLEVWAIR